MLKQKQSFKLLQKLSPQQIQLMKLLQIPTANLEQRVKEELEINPALEENNFEDEKDPFELNLKDNEEEKEQEKDKNDEIDLSEYLTDDDVAGYKLRDTYSYRNSDDDNKTIPIPIITSFHEVLNQQLGMTDLNKRDIKIVKQLIGSLDDGGYLRRDLEAIVDDLAFSQNVMTDEEELEKLLKVVQNFDPAGVGARTLKECLLIQIRRKEHEFTKYHEIAEEILDNYFDEFAKKHYDKLRKQLGLTSYDLKAAIGEILKLNPKPGGTFSNGAKPENYIIPDFIIVNENGELYLKLNSRNAPDLRVSDGYRDMLRDYSKTQTKKRSKQQREAVMFIKQKIDSAKWFIDAIKQRQATMLRTMQAILDYQYDYFLTGDETQLRPMILKDIAEITGLDISTVSRVSNSKYAQTEFGTFKLKSFFSESLQTDSGDEVSTREVKKILTEMIDNESKRKPLSDQKLTHGLVAKGYNIARRTVAKYREQLGIPVARLRKQL